MNRAMTSTSENSTLQQVPDSIHLIKTIRLKSPTLPKPSPNNIKAGSTPCRLSSRPNTRPERAEGMRETRQCTRATRNEERLEPATNDLSAPCTPAGKNLDWITLSMTRTLKGSTQPQILYPKPSDNEQQAWKPWLGN